ncbi:hypothetical protein [Alicyclobacillus acidiphilus]|nr:hypothetical protein [Alicyclobacillus acidiphilus]
MDTEMVGKKEVAKTTQSTFVIKLNQQQLDQINGQSDADAGSTGNSVTNSVYGPSDDDGSAKTVMVIQLNIKTTFAYAKKPVSKPKGL